MIASTAGVIYVCFAVNSIFPIVALTNVVIVVLMNFAVVNFTR